MRFKGIESNRSTTTRELARASEGTVARSTTHDGRTTRARDGRTTDENMCAVASRFVNAGSSSSSRRRWWKRSARRWANLGCGARASPPTVGGIEGGGHQQQQRNAYGGAPQAQVQGYGAPQGGHGASPMQQQQHHQQQQQPRGGGYGGYGGGVDGGAQGQYRRDGGPVARNEAPMARRMIADLNRTRTDGLFALGIRVSWSCVRTPTHARRGQGARF